MAEILPMQRKTLINQSVNQLQSFTQGYFIKIDYLALLDRQRTNVNYRVF